MPTTAPRLLRTYVDPDGARRELIARIGAAGSTLVIDRLAASERDQRLLAHLAPDEPEENARLVCHDYLAREPVGRRCRTLLAADARTVPLDPPALHAPGSADALDAAVVRAGVCFRLELRAARLRIPELRWTRRSQSSCAEAKTVSLREAIGEAESYEPFRALTRQALDRRRGDASVSTITLRTELERVDASTIVLNRALREAVVSAVRSGETSMSAIAMRCGRIKRDGRGNQSGETSWLARRVGLLAEGGGAVATPWVHSEVLGLIARHGLGISPREVELG
jgi:hypothetical protein